jgi:hypothetical protein
MARHVEEGCGQIVVERRRDLEIPACAGRFSKKIVSLPPACFTESAAGGRPINRFVTDRRQ